MLGSIFIKVVQKQHNLLSSQFSRVSQDKSVYNTSVYYEFTELASKNTQHRFKDINAKNKVNRAYALPGNQKYIVKMLEIFHFYLLMLHTFTCRPMSWYQHIKKCATFTIKESGIGVRHTNY